MPASLNGLQVPCDLVALHGEQADLGFQREAVVLAAAGHLLVVPDDVFQRERDLLPGLELDDVGDLFLLDRRQLDEPRQAALAGDGDRHAIADQRLRDRNWASASRISSSRSASGWLRILGYSM